MACAARASSGKQNDMKVVICCLLLVALSNERRVTTIFVKQEGRWLTAGRQSTPIVQPK
jgi:hypothetical protein